jgi:hypothetical protein
VPTEVNGLDETKLRRSGDSDSAEVGVAWEDTRYIAAYTYSKCKMII